MPDPILSISELRADYGGTPVLHGVDLEVQKGQVCGLIGPNGHGKSTLLNVISGLLRPQSGQISFEGQAIAGKPPVQVVELGVIHVPQGDMLFPEMSVLDNLLIGATRPAAHERANATLDLVFDLLPRLKERRDQTALTLSGGERRMLAIGRGLMAQGSFLMLDEPSLGLAPTVIDEIYAVIRDLVAATGQSVLLVEENAMRAAEMSDHMILMDHGQITWQGDAAHMASELTLDQAYFGG